MSRRVLISGELDVAAGGYTSRRVPTGVVNDENASPWTARSNLLVTPIKEVECTTPSPTRGGVRNARGGGGGGGREGGRLFAGKSLLGSLVMVLAAAGLFWAGSASRSNSATTTPTVMEQTTALMESFGRPLPHEGGPISADALQKQYNNVMQELTSMKQYVEKIKADAKRQNAEKKEPHQTELAKMQSFIGKLESRIEEMAEVEQRHEETRRQEDQAIAALAVPLVNIANPVLGARIWTERVHTLPTTYAEFSANLLRSVAVKQQRYSSSPLPRKNAPETLIDEVAVRGYGDGYCVENSRFLSAGVVLPYLAEISAIQVEHVAPKYDQRPEARPTKIEWKIYNKLQKIQAHTDSAVIRFDEAGRWRADLPPDLGPAERVSFTVESSNDFITCMYRIRLFAKPRSDI